MKYEIQHFTLCDGWVNCWSIEDDNGNYVPEYFETLEQAQVALQDHLEDTRMEFLEGNLETEDDPEDFRIVEITQ